ncbi:MAG TPA: DUF3291 domain-containing protein [Methylomirabilota bacterium]|nr:DUF3291 domain-containing protein [Methylomirabilota bacterium]
MTRYHLAQFNLARLRQPLDHPEIADFKAWIDPIHALADRAPGFVWRLVADGENDATSLRPYGEDGIINFTVWESLEALAAFVYHDEHAAALRRRREWFHPATEPNVVMWWIPAGHIPTLEEALERLDHLRRHGPSPRAFTYQQSYGPEAAADPDPR